MSDDWKKALSDDRDRAMSLWEQELRAEAATLYADVVARWPPHNLHYPLVLGEYACVLSELGRSEDALVQYQAALESELAQGGPSGRLVRSMKRVPRLAGPSRQHRPRSRRQVCASTSQRSSVATATWAHRVRSSQRVSGEAAA